MIKDKTKDKNLFLLGIMIGVLAIITMTPTTNAFANTYLPNKTMELDKGEKGEYCIYLQNTGEKNLTQTIEIFDGKEHIKNLNKIMEEYEVPTNTISDDLPVCMKLKLPKETQKGKKYLITYGISTKPDKEQENGAVTFAPIRIREKFYITEKKEPKQPRNIIKYWWIPAITIIIIIALIIILYKKRKKENEELLTIRNL